MIRKIYDNLVKKMRVISGTCKGRQLKSVPGSQTRPTTDKIKETIFNVIGPYFTEGLGLDLFAGSGGLGIEALSRGLDKVIFVDRDMNAIQTIKRNIALCGLEEKSEIYRNDSERALKAIIKRDLQFDYIFLDPPYYRQKLVSLLKLIDESKLLKAQGAIICEHSTDVELPQNIGKLVQGKAGDYGSIGLTIYVIDVDKGVQL
ncbi:16S rRNA (guanine(966)-N(2))-methyltransferase RsmD [Lederbergia citrea]|uniref:16S rRNA (Guanine(966)-N(2))-methyltransferase RsmD n=1 Tax=Lederbergia citrea TaxID=2833581 RepID=A0A942UM94_9BACI|nr:16S rRNA (guanine(966)-N(2))-methyltransferase RsmD [Lederbergia citrea]MBS4177236.1 16S rRNA (guanine(966)-N(2))-methyltransferase RsmD [Lederbergia citrea]MBS4203899.1 16S rRNA (guanine(966)-N(2))-methyltransferase RsmD [Lederbergia citrea]MBS4221516.1 16S rRNA (guanine(966)-N(2))-methyltransferase RsmD [Lederbergia citrea]